MTPLEKLKQEVKEKYPNLYNYHPASWSEPDDKGTRTAIPAHKTRSEIDEIVTTTYQQALKESDEDIELLTKEIASLREDVDCENCKAVKEISKY